MRIIDSISAPSEISFCGSTIVFFVQTLLIDFHLTCWFMICEFKRISIAQISFPWCAQHRVTFTNSSLTSCRSGKKMSYFWPMNVLNKSVKKVSNHRTAVRILRYTRYWFQQGQIPMLDIIPLLRKIGIYFLFALTKFHEKLTPV